MRGRAIVSALSICALLAAVAPRVLIAQTLPGGGISLAWDDCYTGGGGASKTFACDADAAQPFMLIASVIPPQGITQYVGTIAMIRFQFGSGIMPDWWSFGSCQPGNGITAAPMMPSANDASCPDLFEALHFGGQDFQVQHHRPGMARLRTAYAIDPVLTGPVTLNEEAVVLRIRISGRRTAGAGACAGCQAALCILFESLLLDQVDPNLPRGLVTSGEQQFAYWNVHGPITCYTPTEPRTWGQLKSLYR